MNKGDIIDLLLCRKYSETELFAKADQISTSYFHGGVSIRGLLELSNICTKDCLYCGIRKSNILVNRYTISSGDVLTAIEQAYKIGYSSIVIQSGERQDQSFTDFISNLIKEIKSKFPVGITLSLGEQTEDTYKEWYNAGAHRYLLRIETSNKNLYENIHPKDKTHNHQTRINCLKTIKNIGYQLGSGIMIGLPGQNVEMLADDLLFLKDIDVDMVGMGPYLVHSNSPLGKYVEEYPSAIPSLEERFSLCLRMISCLRILMPDINIAATTALQAIHEDGREQAIKIGANVIMPNITPITNRGNYKLYSSKPGMDEGCSESTQKLEKSLSSIGHHLRLNEWGDSPHATR